MIENWNRESFVQKALENNGFSCVEFYGRGLPVKQTNGKSLEEAAREFSSVTFGKIDAAKEEALAEKYAIRTLPTLMVFSSGRGVSSLVGDADTPKIVNFISGSIRGEI